ncbi:transaldolase [Limnobacter humi]|uniref:Transaldolase n=1 Tax=Limnobacter humi TaxID=1778671 RepID=A0ABT1WBQ5_9BURK|nr:transaldolase [Limnobacter humi]MCQ8894940.1 transaldolase [Limnobacter humi]
MTNTLEQLKTVTTVVADTGDFQAIGAYQPQDATTNPSLILKAVQKADYAHLLNTVQTRHGGESLDLQTDRLLVDFGLKILGIIPGRVSTEVDARLSFDVQATVERARRIVQLYRAHGVDTEKRLLIKIASTWEGIQAARVLEQEGIHCNLTLLFSPMQAHACAKAGVRLISPFVGRIYDWYKKSAGTQWNEQAHAGEHDPGVQSVRRIYAYFKQQGISTEVMGASFRNAGQIKALAGCDLLTISPELLAELQQSTETLKVDLSPSWALQQPKEHFGDTEAEFRYAVNADAMATEKLAEGIRAFVKDSITLDGLLKG